ncbi:MULTISPECIES: OmpA family protein [unclassified Pedobacter]|uniref:OmpA family protein n=1 Tax=unclassified Pedobacter TaxID=2628915 RepID=UPI001D6ADEA3|nr:MULTISPECIES: OmpA family protein [unclassified Pedobacter]CAH0175535.1 Outer membrane porin F [Pedobacter sp. Bi36]CAH0231460.1 Outer membrane porin F [Pedobacter sp. Bi126]
MAKGIKKIIWTGEGKVYNANKGSIPGQLVVVAPDQYVWFKIGEWQPGTTEQDRKKDIKWAVFNEKSVIDLQKTIPSNFSYGYRIPKKLCGPYLWYIEATWSGNFDSKSGLKIRGESPAKIVDSRWTQNEGGADVRKTYQFSYGELIWLRLFTEGLNGYDNVEVRVFRKLRSALGLWPKDDEETRKIYRVSVTNGEINLKIPNTYSWYQSMNDRSDVEEFYVRVVHPVTGKYIEDTGGKGDTAHARFLRIKDKLKSQIVEIPENRTPVTIYQPDKNEARFELCKFEQINVTEEGSKPELVFDNGSGVKNVIDKREKTLESIIFKFDSTELLPESLKQLNNILRFLLEHRYSTIQLDGFACVIGKQNHNNVLSENRAKTVREFFIKGKLDPNRIKTAGHGEVTPTDDKKGRDNIKYKNEADYQNNRRVDIAFEYYGHNAQTIIYETIVGNKPKDITVEPVKFDTKACFDRKKHNKTIKLINIDVKAENEGKITVPAVSTMSKFNVIPLNYIWPKRDGLMNNYMVHIHSCRYYSVQNNPTLAIHVYSDIKWTIEFKWSHTQPFAYTYGNKLYGYELDEAKKKAIGAAVDAGWSENFGEMAQKFELSFVGEWTTSAGKKQKVEFSKEWSERIAKTLRVINQVKQMADRVSNSCLAKGRFMFEVKAPVLAVSAQWYLKKTNKVVGEIVEIGAETKPLIEAALSIDLIDIVLKYGGNAICPGAGEVLTWIKDKMNKYVKITFLITVGGALNIAGKSIINVKFPKETTGEVKITGELKVNIEFKATAKAETGSMGVSGIVKADAKTSVTGGVKLGADKEGVFVAPIAEFGGIKATFVAATTIKFGFIKRTFSFDGDAVLVEKDDVKFKKHYLV